MKSLQTECLFFKKFSTFQSSKQTVFDLLTSSKYPPEVCGYGIRSLKLSEDNKKIEIKPAFKTAVESSFLMKELKRIVIPQSTQEALKIQRKNGEIDYGRNALGLKTTLKMQTQHPMHSVSEKERSLQKLSAEQIDKYAKCEYYQFSFVLEKGGRIDFVASSYESFKCWVNGLNALLAHKKLFEKGI